MTSHLSLSLTLQKVPLNTYSRRIHFTNNQQQLHEQRKKNSLLFEVLKEEIHHLVEEKGLGFGKVMMPVRIALSGQGFLEQEYSSSPLLDGVKSR